MNKDYVTIIIFNKSKVSKDIMLTTMAYIPFCEHHSQTWDLYK